MDTMIHAVINNKVYPLHYSIEVMFAVNEKYGSIQNALEILERDGRDSFDMLRYLAVAMQNDAELCRRAETDLPMEELLTGILHNRLGRVLTKTAGVKGKQFVHQISNAELREVVASVKGLEIDLTEPLGMDSAQVTAGGVLTSGFDPNTMESKLVPGLYACGEVLDIDGDCGGYNLQWAWSSGRMAGMNAGKE